MNHARSGPLVILDPGHGGTQAYGGSSPYGHASPDSIAEKHVNLDLAHRVVARLGSIAELTRSGDTNLSLRERAHAAARSGARVLVSLHANAGPAGERGSEVWVHERHARGSDDLARALHASLDRVGPTRGVFSGPLAVLDPEATGGCAACLVEADYLSDPGGHRRLTDTRSLDAIADAISSGVWTYLGRGYGTSVGLPNLNFGPPGPGGRPLGAVTMSSPFTNMPSQITWGDYNDSDTGAGSYTDVVCIYDARGAEVWREPVRINQLAAGASEVHSVIWTPREPGPVTVRVRLNAGEMPIPEDNLDDNTSELGVTVGVGSTGGAVPYQGYGVGAPVATRQVSAPNPGMTARYRGDQNLGVAPFYGMVRPGLDFSNSFIWLVWPHRRADGDPAPSVDIDLTFELFEQDPQTTPGTPAIDAQTLRVQLVEDQKIGFEYSRLTAQQDYYVRITYVDYAPQGAGLVMWTNAYG
jgi:N-acetylmuramoyl-L-alanine amidase